MRANLFPGTLSWLEIDLDALAGNVRTLRSRLAPGARLGAVVKSNAYGHGVELVAPAALAAGADTLIVGNLAEGLEVRRLVGPDVPVLVVGHVPRAGFPEAVRAGLDLTVYDREAGPALAAAAREAGRPARVHLKVETGTNRQGLRGEQLLALARELAALEGVEIAGVGTHFADIEDTTDHSFAREQLARFLRAVARLEEAGIRPGMRHTACSAAVLLFPETHLDLVRAGISVYGFWPSRETLVSARERGLAGDELRPVMTWKARIAQVKDVPAGEYVGYGRTYRATRPLRVAVLPVGYYEGYPRALSGKAHVLVHGRRAPVLGRVCMNMTMVDVTDVPGAATGDEAVLLGRAGAEEVRAEDLAAWAGTIHYEIVSRIHPSLPRIPRPAQDR